MSSSSKVAAFVGVLTIVFTAFGHYALWAESNPELSLTQDEETRLDRYLLNMNQQLRAFSARDAARIADDVSNPIPSGPSGYPGDVEFPTDPVDPIPFDPAGDMFPFPTTSRAGSSEKVALEVLFQTFTFYGVAHIVEKRGSQVDFKIIRSKYNYFTDITKLEVAYAIREFARYLNAHLCGQATMENFYRAFAQVPAEEIGLRFKYDMAWALLGNSLPREPNQIMRLGTKWKALDQVLATTTAFRPGATDTASTSSSAVQAKELKSWMTSLRDVVNILTRLNKLLCYVDIRPNPKEELKKRVVVGKILEMGRRLNERYAEYKEILDQVSKQGKAELVSNLRK